MPRPNWNSGQVSQWGRDSFLLGGNARASNPVSSYIASDGVVLPGLAGEYPNTPDAAALDITGDIDIRAKVTMTDWTPAGSQQAIISKLDGGNNGYQLEVKTDGKLRFYGGGNAESSVATGIADGTTKWVRATLDVDNGAGGRTFEFFLSDDGVTWTQLGTSQIVAGTTTIGVNNQNLTFGSYAPTAQFLLVGTLHRAQVLSGINGTIVVDANFEEATEDAIAFSESSTNGFTITINTTRYSFGLPNVQWSASNVTQALSANTVYYQPFLVTAPIYVDATNFAISANSSGASNVRTGVYRADGNLQPIGGPVIDAGNTSVGASTTGIFLNQITPVLLQPGMYLTAINASAAMTLRVQRGGIVGSDLRNLASSIFSLMSASQTQGAFPNPGTGWTSRSFGSTGPNHVLFLRWSPAS